MECFKTSGIYYKFNVPVNIKIINLRKLELYKNYNKMKLKLKKMKIK